MLQLVLLQSDQQMVTGAALLGSGYAQLVCDISAYHWQIMIYLVWFSSFTHLATLTVLRRHLKHNSPMRWWRLLLMLLIGAGIAVALVPTGGPRWPLSPWNTGSDMGAPARCYYNVYNFNHGNEQLGSMVCSIFILAVSYISRAISFFERSSTAVRLYLRTKPGNVVKRLLEKLYRRSQVSRNGKMVFSIPYWSILSIFIIFRALYDIAGSMMWEVCKVAHFLIMVSFANLPT